MVRDRTGSAQFQTRSNSTLLNLIHLTCITYSHALGLGDHYVLRLDVAVHYLVLVQVRNRPHELLEYLRAHILTIPALHICIAGSAKYSICHVKLTSTRVRVDEQFLRCLAPEKTFEQRLAFYKLGQ